MTDGELPGRSELPSVAETRFLQTVESLLPDWSTLHDD